MDVYPIGLIGLSNRRTVVVGGGSIASRKVRGLLTAGAHVTVISPDLNPELRRLAAAGRVTLVERAYRAGDLAGAFIVIGATDDPAVNEAVWQEAEERGCLVNVVDDPPHCNFILPAIVRRGPVSVSISTGGSSPALARRLRERLEALIGPEYGQLAALLGELRPELLARYKDEKARMQAAFRLVDSDLFDIIQEEGLNEARKRAWELLTKTDAGE